WPMVNPVLERQRLVGGELRLQGAVTKNRAPLLLPLGGRLLDVFARRWAARHPTCPAVFHRRGRRVDRFDKIWREATAAIGRPGFLFHDLRRSGARALPRARVGVETILELRGRETRARFARHGPVHAPAPPGARAPATAA